MPIVYDTILGPSPATPLDIEAFVEALGVLLGEGLVRGPAAVLSGPEPHFPLFLDHRQGAGPIAGSAGEVALVSSEVDELAACVRDHFAAGRNVAVWFQSFDWECDRVAADLELEEDEASLECTVAIHLAQTPADPGISSPYYGTDFKPYFGAITQYLETRGTGAPIDDELLLSVIARRLSEVWGPLRAGTSMVSTLVLDDEFIKA